jgi:hypothetical protein
MRFESKLAIMVIAAVLFLGIVAASSPAAQAQVMVFSTVAQGTGEQMAVKFGLEITINSFSGPEDEKVLWEAFQQGGNQAVAAALKKMPKRGQLDPSRGAPYDITYAREMVQPDGTRIIRVVTNRFVTLAESQGRAKWSTDFDISAVQLELNPDMKKSTGTFLPACQFTMSKEKGFQIALRENPWKLIWIVDKTKTK